MKHSIIVFGLFLFGCTDAFVPETESFERRVDIDHQVITPEEREVVEQKPNDVIDQFEGPIAVQSSDLVEEETMFFELMNQERQDAGLAPLVTYWGLEDDALAHSQRMADADDLHHNPNLRDVVPSGYWRALGENVGHGHAPLALHKAFMNSPGHAANVLGEHYTHVGIKAVRDDDQSLWVTFVFMQTNIDGIENTFGPFHDDDFTTHEASIAKIYDAGITFGCSQSPIQYCPNSTVTRGQMAAFLVRALELPSSNVDAFTDDTGTWYEGVANALAASGITKGCGATTFCGNDDVTRGQMATFLDRGFEYPTATADHFTDDDGRFYEAHANDLASAGITQGCGSGRFCGENALSRAEMATFLARALNL